MNKDFTISMLEDESIDSYIDRLLYAKKFLGLEYSWKQLSEIIYKNTGIHKDESTYRKRANVIFCEINEDQLSMFDEEEEQKKDLQDLINEFKIERYKVRDINNQNNAYLRRISREQTIKEIASEAAKEIAKSVQLPHIKISPASNNEKEAILQLSDWHYGMEVDNYWNKFNPDICKERINYLKYKVIETCRFFDIDRLHIVNLSDLIAGRIHASIRYESRCDVITQTIAVAEILAEFISFIVAQGIQIDYYDCLDNHSRLEPIKSDSLDLESLVRIIPWFLKERLSHYDNVTLHCNTYDEDIIDFYALNGKYRIAGVHGHKDKPGRVVESLTLMTKEHFDLILTAHLHHFSCDEKNETEIVSNGSLMGTDSYAKDLRLCSKPSQNIIIVSEDSVIDYIHRIPLN